MRAVGYVRVSTVGQAEFGVSLDAQRAKIAAWCEANGRELAAVHVDAGLSGRRADNRPALQEALRDVCEGGGALVVYSMSRMSRSTQDAIGISTRLDRAGADLVSLSESIDTTNAAGRMIFRLLAVLAEFESEQIGERVKLVVAHKRARGEYVGGHAPYGKRLDDEGRLVSDPYEQSVIREARRLYEPGRVGLKRVAQHLNAQGYTSRGRRPFQATQVRGMVAEVSP